MLCGIELDYGGLRIAKGVLILVSRVFCHWWAIGSILIGGMVFLLREGIFSNHCV